ncbi:phenylacetic acid degradation protein PaaY [Pseudomonas putida CSV86]|uniref:Phenylacetic acid degradation protein PaaY n=1 Tax=Pseudomonas bharatica CSV86 TaxID=1005395 RepID=L1M2C3_9PSED|nr:MULTISPECIES: phenylacetic acid degradation protein PaaY [Pseudomonas]MDG9883893.1 phenylacetic acid degradation protein PaaY [Pseudomonas sp. GD04058]NNJ15734.1 phenylacetic acid degradation protein PaaY [Pseudomonas bharatica CSV86]
MACYSIDGLTPVVHPTAYVHPSAVLIGDVIIGPQCYVGPLAALRGDFGRIVLEEGANLQDTCVMHGFPASDTVVERNGHVGHGAVLHGCVVGEDALIGMNAVILDNARIAPRCIVSAGALVKAGFQCEEQSLVLGSPAKVTRRLSDEEVAWKQTGTRAYQQLTRRCLETLHECAPLTEVEAGRGRYRDDAVRPKLPGGA